MSALADRDTSPEPTRRGGNWTDLRTRTLSALILAPVAVLCLWVGGTAWAGLMAATAVGLGLEWSALCGQPARSPAAIITMAALLAGSILALAGQTGSVAPALLMGAGIAGLLARSPSLAAGVLYAGLPLAALAWLRLGGDVGRASLLFLIAVVWASDIGAYVAGRLLGGPRLAPAISPGKTWSGAVGGLLAAMLAGALAAHLLASPESGLAPGAGLARAALVAGVLGIVSQLGDLLESWIKRRFGVKDSGWLIPGHGGLLDRLDGLLAAALAAACIVHLTGRGGVLWN